MVKFLIEKVAQLLAIFSRTVSNRTKSSGNLTPPKKITLTIPTTSGLGSRSKSQMDTSVYKKKTVISNYVIFKNKFALVLL